jgi:hypothetical protein
MKRIILSVSFYVIVSSILSLKTPSKEFYLKTLSFDRSDEIVNNLIKPSLPISDEKKN